MATKIALAHLTRKLLNKTRTNESTTQEATIGTNPPTLTASPAIRVTTTGNGFDQPSGRYHYRPNLHNGTPGALRTHWLHIHIRYRKSRTLKTSDQQSRT